MGHEHHGGGGAVAVAQGTRRFALVGAPNSGKTTLFNALCGLHARTGNYPGVTVSRYEGVTRLGDAEFLVEDLPGTYSLDPISPDEEVVESVLDVDRDEPRTPDGLLILLDATTLRRSLLMAAQALNTGLPATVVLTFGDELAKRGGGLDLPALERALGVPVKNVPAADPRAVQDLREHLEHAHHWSRPVVAPPTDPTESSAWVESVLTAAHYRVGEPDDRTRRIDAVLLHPVWGLLIFLVTMFVFFQVIFTVAAPLQDLVESFFGWLGGLVAAYVTVPWLSAFLSQALIGGIGGVLVFLPQIALLFVMIALLEGTGYMTRAAFLMDRVMGRFGLEGRAFVALLSSVACAIPGIMATRSLPSAKDRLATMLAAPLMTCSARLPVYVMLIGMMVSADTRWGPIGAQGLVMFLLYLGGALASMATAWVFGRLAGRRIGNLPFYMEMPPYRMPKPSVVGHSVWDACKAFLQKMTTIILGTTIVLWLLLNLPAPSTQQLLQAGVDPADEAAVATYTIDHSAAATVGHVVEPVFEPLGFDWRINVGVLASLSAREVFVATMGQIAAADDPEDPAGALAQMTVQSGPRAGEPLFTPPVTAALLVFFMFALQCMATVAALRRESGGWRWPALAWAYMFALAWVFSFLTRLVVGLFV